MTKVGLSLLVSFAALLVSARQNPPPATNPPAKEVHWPKPVAPPKPIESTLSALTNTPLRMVEPGIFEIGKVRMDQRRRSITLPAVLNRAKGPMEYFLVTSYGKTHESILKTQAEPYHIHLAMLLLGARTPGSNDLPGIPPNGVPGPIIHPSSQIISGSKVAINVHWEGVGAVMDFTAEDLVLNTKTQTTLPHGYWVYNGSIIMDGRFLAQMDGSIASLVTDPVALINSTGPGHDNDLIWEPNSANLPPPGAPVEVTITLQDDPQPKP